MIPAVLALAALVIAGCGDDPADPLAPGAPSAARVTPGATFDWSMPARFGFDRDGDGLIDYPRAPEQIRPAAWTVAFDACGIAADRYTWYVDRRPVARVATCTYEHQFATEGAYDVAVHAVSTPGASVWAEERVTVQDWLVVSFGDSYASGEGVPEVPQASEALVRRIEALVRDLQEAQRQRELARTRLAEALERKGLAEDILEDARQRRQAFLNACTIDEFTDIKQCADFLVARALSFELYEDAKKHFDQAVQNANERLNDAIAAVEAARAAVAAAQSAIDNLVGAIEAARGDFEEPRWQRKFALETWEDPECHRSANAAPARAALALEAADPRTSVTFVHLACSGAKMTGDRAPVETQVRWADALIGDREIDAVLLSIGGNDAGFADLATGCAVQEPCFIDDPVIDLADAEVLCGVLSLLFSGCTEFFENSVPDRSAKQVLAEGLALLPGRYETLARVDLPLLRGLLAPPAGGPGLDGRGRPGPAVAAVDRVRSGRVYISEYVDMTRDETAGYCQGFDASDPLGTMPGFTPAEMYWLDNTAAKGINAAVEDAATAHGWTFVTGIHAGYRTRGYCAQPHWVVRIHESFLGQGDMNGTAHPNRDGLLFNGDAIHAALVGDLYPEGIGGPPRAPDRPRAPVTTPPAR